MTENERVVLSNFLVHGGDLESAIQQFLEERYQYCEQQAAEAMRSVPRKFELASDYASKAEVYRELWKELERWAEKN